MPDPMKIFLQILTFLETAFSSHITQKIQLLTILLIHRENKRKSQLQLLDDKENSTSTLHLVFPHPYPLRHHQSNVAPLLTLQL